MNKSILTLLIAGLSFAWTGLTQAQNTYEAKAGMSYIIFKTTHFGVNPAYGRFDNFTGTIVGNPNDPSGFKMNFEVMADSVNTGIKKRDDHLRGPDFFKVKEFPKITFVSKSVKAVEDKENTFAVTGDITLLGVTKEVTAMFEYYGTGKSMKGDEIAGGEATLSVNRSDFGMKYGIPGIADKVSLMVSLQGYKK